MKHAHINEFPRVPSLVRKYQALWEVCLVEKKCSYYWPDMSSLANFKGYVLRQSSE
jgi:hypothetical protein